MARAKNDQPELQQQFQLRKDNVVKVVGTERQRHQLLALGYQEENLTQPDNEEKAPKEDK